MFFFYFLQKYVLISFLNLQVLIATDVCARGIDISKVTLVINFNLPRLPNGGADCQTYLSRIGRTGRFGLYGIVVNFVCGARDMRILKEIEDLFEKPILPLDEADFSDLDVLFKSEEE